MVRRSTEALLAASSVSVFSPSNAERSNPCDERTSTFLSSIVAFGNFFISDSLYDSLEILVSKFRFRVLRTIAPTLFCIARDIMNRITSRVPIIMDVILSKLIDSFI